MTALPAEAEGRRVVSTAATKVSLGGQATVHLRQRLGDQGLTALPPIPVALRCPAWVPSHTQPAPRGLLADTQSADRLLLVQQHKVACLAARVRVAF
jgi:hypothetical protein